MCSKLHPGRGITPRRTNLTFYFSLTYKAVSRWWKSCTLNLRAQPSGVDRGATLLSWTGEDVESKPKHSMVAILSVLFVVAYCMMTMLIVEQARTIDTQRNLIEVLFDDSAQLSALKGKVAQKQYAESQAAAKAAAHAAITL